MSDRKPDFNNLLKVLRRERPDRYTLFEFYLNTPLYEQLAGFPSVTEWRWDTRLLIEGFKNAGYDYATIVASSFNFPTKAYGEGKTQSLNAAAVITNREEFEHYPFPNAADFDYSCLDECLLHLPEGMKMIVWGNGGILETVIQLVGYDNLCLMIYDDEQLVADVFTAVGSRFLDYYKICAPHPAVGALISNDDWGFNTQLMFPPDFLREHLFPWHKKIVEVIHAEGKPAILHSCGNLDSVMDDIIDDMKYDAKHSFEDNILPVEQAYERYHDRIAILGGLDIDFVCRKSPEAVKERARNMLKIGEQGGYALGTGNSIPTYVPLENYFAMISAALEA